MLPKHQYQFQKQTVPRIILRSIADRDSMVQEGGQLKDSSQEFWKTQGETFKAVVEVQEDGRLTVQRCAPKEATLKSRRVIPSSLSDTKLCFIELGDSNISNFARIVFWKRFLGKSIF